MTSADMRGWVKSAYPGPNWAKKVDKMTDEQVLAIYQRLVRTGKISNTMVELLKSQVNLIKEERYD